MVNCVWMCFRLFRGSESKGGEDLGGTSSGGVKRSVKC